VASKSSQNLLVYFAGSATVNKEKYNDILRRLRDVVRRKRPENRRTNLWFLLHDYAPTHRSVLVKDFLAKNNMTALEHPPYSPDWFQLFFTCSLD
jgi:transposase